MCIRDRPNRLASSLSTGRTRLVGLIADDFVNPFFLGVFDLFTQGLQAQGLRPLLINLSGQTAPDGPLRMLREYAVEAAILVSATLPASFAAAFAQAGIPIVHAFATSGADPAVATAGIDDVAAGRLAGRVLAARGYRKPAFVGGPRSTLPTRDRLAGFCAGFGNTDA